MNPTATAFTPTGFHHGSMCLLSEFLHQQAVKAALNGCRCPRTPPQLFAGKPLRISPGEWIAKRESEGMNKSDAQESLERYNDKHREMLMEEMLSRPEFFQNAQKANTEYDRMKEKGELEDLMIFPKKNKDSRVKRIEKTARDTTRPPQNVPFRPMKQGPHREYLPKMPSSFIDEASARVTQTMASIGPSQNHHLDYSLQLKRDLRPNVLPPASQEQRGLPGRLGFPKEQVPLSARSIMSPPKLSTSPIPLRHAFRKTSADTGKQTQLPEIFDPNDTNRLSLETALSLHLSGEKVRRIENWLDHQDGLTNDVKSNDEALLLACDEEKPLPTRLITTGLIPAPKITRQRDWLLQREIEEDEMLEARMEAEQRREAEEHHTLNARKSQGCRMQNPQQSGFWCHEHARKSWHCRMEGMSLTSSVHAWRRRAPAWGGRG